MNVLMLSWEYRPNVVGGLGVHVDHLASVLARKGVKVHVVTPAVKGGAEEETDGNLHVSRVDGNLGGGDFIEQVMIANDYIYGRAAATAATQPGPWLIHAHDWLVGPAAKRLKHDYQLPLLATIHATEHGRNHGIHNELQRRVHEQEYELSYEAQYVIACSRFMAAQVRDVFQAPPDKIGVIPNGVEVPGQDQGFDRQAFRRCYAGDDEKLVLNVGRLVAEKGIDVVLRAVPKALEVLPDLKFVVVGMGPGLEYAKEYAAAQEWANKMYFTGFVSDEVRNRLYQVADVAIFPSLYEPFGIVALEAMGFRVPVVVSNSGGLTEVVDGDRTGVIVEAGSDDSLAWGLAHVLRQPWLSQLRVEAAYQRVVSEFNWDVVAEKTIGVYRRLLGG
ncbi:MAG: glycosyltransferase family 4 protein [Chloroflexota bacterium]|nr:glycosyltransferase family 4 protein [Chloroflexota bacterium]